VNNHAQLQAVGQALHSTLFNSSFFSFHALYAQTASKTEIKSQLFQV
jgi:hypothetical protein